MHAADFFLSVKLLDHTRKTALEPLSGVSPGYGACNPAALVTFGTVSR